MNFLFFRLRKKKGKVQDKGVTQLLNCIETQLDLILTNEDTVSDTDFNVYPILVYEDSSFGIEGINYILNEKFQELRQAREIHSKYCVKELVMIKMEDLFMLEDFFKDGKLELKTLIDDYFIDCKLIENELQPFGKFTVQSAVKKGYEEKLTSRFHAIHNNLVKRNQPNS